VVDGGSSPTSTSTSEGAGETAADARHECTVTARDASAVTRRGLTGSRASSLRAQEREPRSGSATRRSCSPELGAPGPGSPALLARPPRRSLLACDLRHDVALPASSRDGASLSGALAHRFSLERSRSRPFSKWLILWATPSGPEWRQTGKSSAISCCSHDKSGPRYKTTLKTAEEKSPAVFSLCLCFFARALSSKTSSSASTSSQRR
jgi:hypothetical protein